VPNEEEEPEDEGSYNQAWGENIAGASSHRALPEPKGA